MGERLWRADSRETLSDRARLIEKELISMKTTSHVTRAGLMALMVVLSGSLLLVNCSYIPAFGKTVSEQKVLKGKVERDIALADELMQKGRFSDAADVYWQALNRNTKSVPATVGLGMAQVKQFKL